jgi:hypothetical protein
VKNAFIVLIAVVSQAYTDIKVHILNTCSLLYINYN